MRLVSVQNDPVWEGVRARLEARSIPEPNSGCLLWLGAYHVFGYGRMNVKGTIIDTHRLAYALHNGPVDDEDHVLHTCDVPPCINPDHLYLGGNKENAADRIARGRMNPCIGRKNGRAKLTETQVLDILFDTRSHRTIAAAYGVSKGPITAIKHGIIWKSVTRGLI